MSDMTNIEYLKQHNAFDDSDMSDEHRDMLNNEFTREEMETIKKLVKIKGTPFKPDKSGAAL